MAYDLPADDIILQVTPKLPIGDVWTGLAQPEHMVKWLAPKVKFEPVVGGPFELFWDLGEPSKDSTEGCKVLKFQEPDELAFTWRGPPRFAMLMNQGAPITEVYIRVAPCPEGIDVTLEHKGWGAGDAWEEARSWHFHFWEDVLQRYKDYVMTGDSTGPASRT